MSRLSLDDVRTLIATLRYGMDDSMPYSADLVEQLLSEHEEALQLLEAALLLGDAADALPLSFYEMVNSTRLNEVERSTLRTVLKRLREWNNVAGKLRRPIARIRESKRRPSVRRRSGAAVARSTRLLRARDSEPPNE